MHVDTSIACIPVSQLCALVITNTFKTMRIIAKQQQHENRERLLSQRPWKNSTAVTVYFKDYGAWCGRHATD